MNDRPVYRVAKWVGTFETSKSRTYKTLPWISVPTGFSSNGYEKLIEHFGDRSPAIYGAWIALAMVAATCPVRGVLMNSKGVGLTAGRLSFQTHFPSTVFEELIDWCLLDEVKWLEVLPINESMSLRESLDALESDVGLPLRNVTDVTERNGTKRNTTDVTNGSDVGLSLDEKITMLSVDEIKNGARKLDRAMGSDLPAIVIWQASCVDILFGDGFLNDLIVSARNKARNRKKYVLGALRRSCEERGISFGVLKNSFPAMPSKRDDSDAA